MRNLTASISILLTCTMFYGAANAASDRIYLEEDGIVVFDVEDAEPAEGWQLKTDLENFKGSGYFEWTGRNSFPKETAGRGSMTYRIRIETAGNYQLRWRSHIAVGELSTEHNDSWVRLATGQNIVDEHPLDNWTKVYMNTLNDWSWDSRTVDNVGFPIRQYFSEGDHTVEISGRSNGHALDRIALYRHADYGFNPSEIENWELSRMIMDNGSTVEPDETPEPEESQPPVEIVNENLEIAEDSWQQQPSNQCTGNTLAIPAFLTASFNPADPASGYSSMEYLSAEFGASTALLKFDMSLVPPATSAVLEYTTNDQAAEGAVVYSLGSHSDWPMRNGETTPFPDSVLQLGEASGRWEATSRYRSTIPANLLSSQINTIAISGTAQSGPLTFYARLSEDLTPRLVLTGDETFCDTWQANVDASNVVAEPPPEEESEEQSEVTSPETPEKETEDDKDAQSNSRSSGGALSWLLMLILAGTAHGQRMLCQRFVHSNK